MSAAVWTTGVLNRYRESGMVGRLAPGSRPAVVVVDLQRGFTDPTCGPGFTLDAVVEATRELVGRAREAGLPVFFTAIAFPPASTSVWLRKMPVLGALREGSGWETIDPRLAPTALERVVVKQAASAFAGTDLADILGAAGVDTVIICGATTSGCVRATAVDACALDLPTFIVRECVGDREPGPHDAALLDLDAKYADVLSLDEAMEMLGGKR